MNLFESIKLSFKSIKANKMRSVLTMLGIIIGIASVITILSLGEGVRKSMIGQFDKVGTTSVKIGVNLLSENYRKSYDIKKNDYKALKEKIKTIQYISPIQGSKVRAENGTKSRDMYIEGCTEDFIKIIPQKIKYGRFFNDNEVENGKYVCVIDERSAKNLFGRYNVINETINLGKNDNKKKYKVIGVTKILNGESFMPESETALVIVPISAFAKTLSVSENYNNLFYSSDSKENVERSIGQIRDYLEKKHNCIDKKVYMIDKASNILEQVDKIVLMFTAFLGVVAAISLIVGGIGVMNIMLVSVTERTREIGIRKAIGASTADIMQEFLIEALILTSIGGIIGLLIGITGGYILGSKIHIVPVITFTKIAGVLIFSSFIGLFFGMYPAKKAAKMNPIDALRFE